MSEVVMGMVFVTVLSQAMGLLRDWLRDRRMRRILAEVLELRVSVQMRTLPVVRAPEQSPPHWLGRPQDKSREASW